MLILFALTYSPYCSPIHAKQKFTNLGYLSYKLEMPMVFARRLNLIEYSLAYSLTYSYCYSFSISLRKVFEAISWGTQGPSSVTSVCDGIASHGHHLVAPIAIARYEAIPRPVTMGTT